MHRGRCFFFLLILFFSLRAYSVIYFKLPEDNFFSAGCAFAPAKYYCVIYKKKVRYRQVEGHSFTGLGGSIVLPKEKNKEVTVTWEKCLNTEASEEFTDHNTIEVSIDPDIYNKLTGEMLRVNNNNLSLGRQSKSFIDQGGIFGVIACPLSFVHLKNFFLSGFCTNWGQICIGTAIYSGYLYKEGLDVLHNSSCKRIAVALSVKNVKDVVVFEVEKKSNMLKVLQMFLQQVEATCPQRLCYGSQPCLALTESGGLIAIVGIRVFNDEQNNFLKQLYCDHSEFRQSFPLFSYDSAMGFFRMTGCLTGDAVVAQPGKIKPD